MTTERTLWLAVISQAITDATAANATPDDQASARRWLVRRTEDRDEVAVLAGLDPSYLGNIGRRLEAAGWPDIAVLNARPKPPKPKKEKAPPRLKRAEIYELATPVVRELRQQGKTFAAIAAELQGRGIPPVRGGVWGASIVRKLAAA